MAKDECILVDEDDTVTGHANKYRSHRCVWAGRLGAGGWPRVVGRRGEHAAGGAQAG